MAVASLVSEPTGKREKNMLRGEREVQERRSDNDDHAWEYKDMCGSDCCDSG